MAEKPLIVEGELYYAKVNEAVPDWTEKQGIEQGQPGQGKYLWELNLAVTEEVFQQFKDIGVNVGLKEAGGRPYTTLPVINISKWATDFNGNPNKAPIVWDMDKNNYFDPNKDDDEEYIPNGSMARVQWHPHTYSKGKYTRAMLDAVQVTKLVEASSIPEITEEEVGF